MRAALSAVAALGLMGACSDESEPAPAHAQPVADTTSTADHAFDDVLRDWDEWQDVYAELRMAPTMCRLQTGERRSDAPPTSPHGRKVYNLRVSDLLAFMDVAHTEPPIGFAAVKVAFADTPEAPITPGRFVGLFIMKRIGDATTPDTDGGWVYATTDADLKITASGQIASCMSCHAEAPFHRLFGPQEESHGMVEQVRANDPAPAPAPK